MYAGVKKGNFSFVHFIISLSYIFAFQLIINTELHLIETL